MFIKNDNEFICKNCGRKVDKLGYTSRDHCPFCLYSIHVDIEPGDRQNQCKGMLVPINVIADSKKGKVIIYKCCKCKKIVKNIIAKDDSQEEIMKVIQNYIKTGGNIK